MPKNNRFLYLLTAILIAFCACGTAARQEPVPIIFYYDADFWTIYDLSRTSFPTQERFEELTGSYIAQIEERLELTGWLQEINPNADTLVFHLNIQGEKSSTAFLPNVLENEAEVRITLSRKALSSVGFDSALPHELTHMMCHSFSQSLEEGICDYMNDEIGATGFCKELGWDIQEFYKVIPAEYARTRQMSEAELMEIIGFIGKEGIGYPYVKFDTSKALNSPKSTLWYEYSASFVRYLMEHYETEQVVNLIRMGEDESAYTEYLGKSLEDLKKDWLSYMEALEPVHDFQDFEHAIQEFYSKNP